MPWLETPQGDVHYTEAGSGEPLVLIHGLNSAAACWDWHIPALADRYRVIAYDNINHGFSANSPRDGAHPDWVDTLESVVAALAIERPVLIGQSMGAMTSMRYALRHPDAAGAVVAAGMGWPLATPPAALPDPLDTEERIWLGVGDSFTAGWVAANRTTYERYLRVRSTATAIEANRHRRPLTAVNPSWFGDDDLSARFRTLATPLLLFVGVQDGLADGVRNIAKLVPDAELVEVEAAHNAYFERRDEFLTAIDGFLSRVGAAQR